MLPGLRTEVGFRILFVSELATRSGHWPNPGAAVEPPHTSTVVFHLLKPNPIILRFIRHPFSSPKETRKGVGFPPPLTSLMGDIEDGFLPRAICCAFHIGIGRNVFPNPLLSNPTKWLRTHLPRRSARHSFGAAFRNPRVSPWNETASGSDRVRSVCGFQVGYPPMGMCWVG